jgi:hypothetical protein
MKTIHSKPFGKSTFPKALVLAILPFVSLSISADAKQFIRDSFFTFYPSAVGTRLDTLPSHLTHCGVCHYDFGGGGTRNFYGAAIENAGFDLKTVVGRSNAIWSVRFVDSDGDGSTNHIEITDTINYGNTPTFPGLKTSNTNLVSSVSLAEIQNYLTPAVGGDSTPPVVQLLAPNGGQTLTANRTTNITWNAVDASGVASVNLYLSLDNGVTYRALALGLANAGTFSWVPANRPTTQARFKVVATDTYSNSTNDVSDAVFAIVSPPFTNTHGVPTTLRDFDLPGTQPFEHGPDLEASTSCASCHGGYEPAVEPQHGWLGSMMAHAARDPIFLANMAIANQDAADSGDLCLRCHFARGWMAGRSVPTDGSRMTAADGDGVSCALCHRMVDPVYKAGASPTNDLAILAALSFPGTNYGNGMFVVDPTGTRRGPFTDAVAGHAFLGSSFHSSAAFCGTCHDVSNPAFQNDGTGNYNANALDTTSAQFSPHFMAPVERTYSEWLNSEYNTPTGVHAPQFAGNKPDGRVAACQDCHMRDVAGYGANTNNNAGVPWRTNLPMHDLTGGSTWVAGLLTNLFPGEVSVPAIQAGIARATQLLTNSATLALGDAENQLKVTVTNECGHKLPTGYPEGRRVWVNVKFYDEAMTLLGESGAYNPSTGVLTRDTEARIYEVHPGIETNLANALGLVPGPSLHFVLNNQTYEDNRIPPRGFTNANYAAFGGAPVGHHYVDGQYWDDTLYTLPAGATRAEVRLYYQSTSKEFVEFLRDENRTTSHGQAMYDLWANNGMCPPTLIAEKTWVVAFAMKSVRFTPQGNFRMEFLSRPGVSYTIEYKDSLAEATWQPFAANGTFAATATQSCFEDDFTANSSGGISPTGQRYYRFKYTVLP